MEFIFRLLETKQKYFYGKNKYFYDRPTDLSLFDTLK